MNIEYDSSFYQTFPFSKYCFPGNSLVIPGSNSTSLIKIFFFKKDDMTYQELKTTSRIEFYVGRVNYFRQTSSFSMSYNKFTLNVYSFDTFNVYESSLIKYRYFFYNSYIDLISNENVYDLNVYTVQDNSFLLKDNSATAVLTIFIPTRVQDYYFQSYIFFDSISLIIGWIFIFSTVVGFFVSKCAKIKLYESIGNSVFNWIHPQNKIGIINREKEVKELMNSEKTVLVDLLTDDSFKYYEYKGFNLSMTELFIYLFCCEKFKSKTQIALEKSFNVALNELFKNIDITSIIKCSQDVKVMKEIILEKHQKRIFESILSPAVDSEKTISTYTADTSRQVKYYSDDEEISKKERLLDEKEALKKSFFLMSKIDVYKDIDLRLIQLLNINPNLKDIYFQVKEKTAAGISIFSNIHNTPNAKEPILKNFEKILKIYDRQMEDLRYLINSLTNETSELYRNYEQVYNENKGLKDIIFKSDVQMGNIIITIEITNKKEQKREYLPSFVPVKKQADIVDQIQTKKNESKNKKIKKNVNKRKSLKLDLAKEKSKKETEIEKNETQKFKKEEDDKMLNKEDSFLTKVFNFIDTILCVKYRLKRLESIYNQQILEGFRALNHCIRLSFMGFILFLTLNLVTYYYNSPYLDVIYDECKYGLFCLGFLSFMRVPDSIVYNFVLCLLIYMTIIFVYIMSLMIKFFINKTETDFIGNSFQFSKFVFTSPSLRFKSIEDNTNFKNFFYETMVKTRQSFKK
jgi:hypothetical protein